MNCCIIIILKLLALISNVSPESKATGAQLRLSLYSTHTYMYSTVYFYSMLGLTNLRV